MIVSTYVHDFKFCSCKSCAVDGGREYLRRAGNPSDAEDLSCIYMPDVPLMKQRPMILRAKEILESEKRKMVCDEIGISRLRYVDDALEKVDGLIEQMKGL